MNQAIAIEVGEVIGNVIDDVAIQMRAMGAKGIFDKHDVIYKQAMEAMGPVNEMIQLEHCKAVCEYCRGEVEDIQAATDMYNGKVVHRPVEGFYKSHTPTLKPCDAAGIKLTTDRGY